MAAALSLTMGRLGALVGNLVFGYLIDLACVVPIALFAAFLFGKTFPDSNMSSNFQISSIRIFNFYKNLIL